MERLISRSPRQDFTWCGDEGIRVSEIMRENPWLSVFFIYCLLAVFWSDFPLVAFKARSKCRSARHGADFPDGA